MRWAIAAMLIVTLCSACSFIKLSDKEAFRKSEYNKWVGHPLDELLVGYGEPINIYSLEKGTRTFEYWEPEIKTQLSDSEMVSQINQLAQEVPTGPCDNTAVEKMDWPSEIVTVPYKCDNQQWPAWRKRTGKRSKSAQSCMILFKVSATDIVEGWSVECGRPN